VELIERVVVEAKLRTTILASRSFDATDDAALVAASEFAAELAEWADRVNAEREQALAEGAVEHDAALEDAAERERAGPRVEFVSLRLTQSTVGAPPLPILEPDHQLQARPGLVERGNLVVHEAMGEGDLAHDVLGHVGRDARGALRPRHP
jgi:hypothetical protein